MVYLFFFFFLREDTVQKGYAAEDHGDHDEYAEHA
jgi:hypothetical protein